MRVIYPAEYRRDLDGLRGLAIALVVMFHVAPSFVPGGFVGVDIFFVLSGFLITAQLLESLVKKRLSIVNFYGRRIRRLFPALLLVMGTLTVMGPYLLLDEEYAELLRYVSATATSTINKTLIVEYNEYFKSAAQTNPLLHLWSLAIELQFYLVWPLVLWITWKCRLTPLIPICLVGLGSFLLNIDSIQSAPINAFYSTLTRAWEFMIGAVVACVLHMPTTRLNWLPQFRMSRMFLGTKIRKQDIIFALGVLFLVGACTLISAKSAFPGVIALLPTLGAALCVVANSTSTLTRMTLGNPFSVWLGKISYSLYLWHWPILALLRIQKGNEIGLSSSVGAIALSIVLATATFYLVEQPLRSKEYPRIKVVVLLAAMLGLCGAKFAFSVKSDVDSSGLNNRLMIDRCSDLFPAWTKHGDIECRLQAKKEKITIALLGDSHANQLFDGLAERYQDSGEKLASFPSCCQAPLLNMSSAFNESSEALRAVKLNGYKNIKQALEFVVKSESIKKVILAHAPTCDYTLRDNENPNLTKRSIKYSNGFRRTLTMLEKAGKQVFIVISPPRLPFDPLSCQERPISIFKRDCTFTRDLTIAPFRIYNEYQTVAEEEAKEFGNAKVIDLATLFCRGTICSASPEGVLLYRDRGHLTVEGSRYVSAFIAKSLKANG